MTQTSSADASGRPLALITGASGGLGYEFSRVLAREKYNLLLVARREDNLKDVKSELEAKHKVNIDVIAADLSGSDGPRDVFRCVQEQGKTVDVLVNNAAFGQYGDYPELDWSTESGMLQLNVVGLSAMTKLFLPSMLQRKRGHILNVASTAAFFPGPLMTVYYASKAYVLSYSLALADEVKKNGVSVTVLCPGPTETGFQKRADMMVARTVKGRKLASAADVAEYGYRAMMQRKVIAVPGAMNKCLVFLSRLLPRSWQAMIVHRLQSPRSTGKG